MAIAYRERRLKIVMRPKAAELVHAFSLLCFDQLLNVSFIPES